MIYDVLYEKLNPRSGNVRPYVPHDDKESAILYDIEWKGTVHFIVCGWIHFGWYYATRNNEEISETYHFNKIDEKSLKSMQKLIDEIESGKYKNKKTDSEKIKMIVENRKLTSYMNNTKWKELKTAIKEQMYDIPIKYKTLFEQNDPNCYWTIAGDEYFDHMNMSSIEWFKIACEVTYVEKRGRLMEDKVISYNKKNEILQILQKFSISYDYDEIENSYVIYGYK